MPGPKKNIEEQGALERLALIKNREFTLAQMGAEVEAAQAEFRATELKMGLLFKVDEEGKRILEKIKDIKNLLNEAHKANELPGTHEAKMSFLKNKKSEFKIEIESLSSQIQSVLIEQWTWIKKNVREA